MASRKTSEHRKPKKVAAKSATSQPRSMPKEGKDPKGGLTAKGREFFNKKEGSHLRPGVQGPADTPEKMVRKGSFLRRHFTHPRGPMKDEKGQPTRLALSAHAWGEPVPNTAADAGKLAKKGHELLERYHEIKDGAETRPSSPSRSAKRTGVKGTPKPGAKAAGRATATKKVAERAGAGRRAASAPAKVLAAKKATAKKVAAKKDARKRTTR